MMVIEMTEEYENKIRRFLKNNLEFYKSEAYLKRIYPEKDDLNYKVFIKYMTQGFNRKRKHLMSIFNINESTLSSISSRNRWSTEAEKWEKSVIREFVKYMDLPLFDDRFLYRRHPEYIWSIQKNESYIQYFTFLMYLCLNISEKTSEKYQTKYHVYSQSEMAKLLQDGGFRIVSQTLNKYSQENEWVRRIEEYRVNLKAKNMSSSEHDIEKYLNSEDKDYELKKALVISALPDYDKDQLKKILLKMTYKPTSKFYELSSMFHEYVGYLEEELD